MMRRSKKEGPRAVLLAVACSALLWSGRAEAHLFEFYLDAFGGGLYGTPEIAGNKRFPNGENFYNDQSGGLLGAKVGFELFYTDLYLQFDQYFNGVGAAGSSLQLMLGWDIQLGARNNKGWAATLGGYAGLVFGFPYTPRFPISKDQLATFGVAVEGQFGAEYHFNRFFVFQAIGTVGYHYLFRNLEVMIDESGSPSAQLSHGFHLLGKVGFRFHVSVL